MSLIEEALRRAKEPIIQEPQTTPPPAAGATQTPPAHSWQAESTPASAAPPTSTPVLIAVAAAVLVLTAGLVIGGALWIGRTLSRPQAPPAAAQSPAPAPASTPAPEPPKPEPAPAARPVHLPWVSEAPQPQWVLSGVVEGLGAPYAVINGAIVGVGERVGDATLVGIAHGAVTLRQPDGNETTLRVPQ